METLRLADLDAETVAQEDDEGAHWLAAFPFTPGAPGETTAPSDDYTVVYNELDPGARIGSHRDGVDELVYVIEGELAATVDGETATAAAGDLAVVPADAPHAVENVGDGTAKLLGFFASGDFESSFESEPTVLDGDRE